MRLLYTIFFLLVFNNCYTQTVFGSVLDNLTNQPLDLASITIVGNDYSFFTDSKGKLVSKRSVEIVEGTNLIRIEDSLVAGLYYLQINNGTKFSKLIKHVIH